MTYKESKLHSSYNSLAVGRCLRSNQLDSENIIENLRWSTNKQKACLSHKDKLDISKCHYLTVLTKLKSLSLNLHRCGQLIFNKGVRQFKEEREIFSLSNARKQIYSCKEINVELFIQEINSEVIIYLSINIKIMRLLREIVCDANASFLRKNTEVQTKT